MSGFNATQSNPALPITQLLFGSHPAEWADYYAEDYVAPQEVLAQGVTGVWKDSAVSGVPSSDAATDPGLYPHVDVVALLAGVAHEGFDQVCKLEKLSLRTLTRGEFPRSIAKQVFADVDHERLLRMHHIAGTLPTVVECITKGGSPICDIGGDDGRKAMAHWRRKVTSGLWRYKGPKTIISDKEKPKFNMNCPCLGRGESLMKASGAVTNMLYRECDLEDEGVSWVPEEYLLVSINALNQMSPMVFENSIMKRDGIHMVPNVQKLVRDGSSELSSEGKVTTQLMTKRGLEVFHEYPHEFIPTVFPATNQSDHYQILVVFGPRIISADLDEGTVQDLDENSQFFTKKPSRISEKGTSFLPPYKLKRDGQTMVVHVTYDEIVFETLRSRVVLEPSEDHHCPVKLVMQCEMTVSDRMVLIPHTIWLAGRLINGPTICAMMEKTDFRIAGVEFRSPVFHPTMAAAVDALALAKQSEFPSDGIIGSGSGGDVAGKVLESIDIRACDGDVICKIQSQITPRTAVWEVGPNNCVADMSAPQNITPFGDTRHQGCTIREYEVFERGLEVVFREIRVRDKRLPNKLSRIMQTIPRTYDSHEARPQTLLGCMSDQQKAELRRAGFDF